jgi:oligosaccharide translocation protein RFT1
MYIQTLVKEILTEADHLAMAAFTTLEQQGSYSLAANYGGLVARMVFQPIEETSRNLFSKLLSKSESSEVVSQENVKSAKSVLSTLFRGYWIFSLLAVALGPSLSPLLLKLVAGSRWISAGGGQVLSAYCYYIPFLAFNGITEAFVSSVATPVQLHRQSVWMVGFSGAFIAGAFVFSRLLGLGAVGVVWANVLTMFCRYLWSMSFIMGYFSENKQPLGLGSTQPTSTTAAASAAAAALLWQLHLGSGSLIKELVTGSVVAFSLLITV